MIEEQFLAGFLLLKRDMTARMDTRLEEVGLSGIKLWALHHLVEAGGHLTISALAAGIHSGRSNATQLVNRMVADELVERVPHPDDRRSVLVSITPEGERRYKIGAAVRLDVARDYLSPLNDDEQRVFIAMLQRMLAQG